MEPELYKDNTLKTIDINWEVCVLSVHPTH